MTFLDNHTIFVGEHRKTVFQNQIDIYQDGTTPMYRDVDGRLWAMSGHSHMGHIGMFCGTCLDDLQEVWPSIPTSVLDMLNSLFPASAILKVSSPGAASGPSACIYVLKPIVFSAFSITKPVGMEKVQLMIPLVPVKPLRWIRTFAT